MLITCIHHKLQKKYKKSRTLTLRRREEMNCELELELLIKKNHERTKKKQELLEVSKFPIEIFWNLEAR